jgi:hypothetical protein
MSASETTKTTIDESAIDWQVWVTAAVVLGLLGGLVFGFLAPGLDGAEDPVKGFVRFLLVIAGVMLGAGFGLSLGDFRRSTTTEKKVASDDPALLAEAGPGQTVVTESLKVIKDLTPGKTLIVLSVALLGLSLWAITPSKPDTQVTVQSPQ